MIRSALKLASFGLALAKANPLKVAAILTGAKFTLADRNGHGHTFQLPNVGEAILNKVREQFTVTMTVNPLDDFLPYIDTWLSDHPQMKAARNVNVIRMIRPPKGNGAGSFAEEHTYNNRRDFGLVAGHGTHVIVFEGVPLIFRRYAPDTPSGTGVKGGLSFISVTAPGTDPAIFRRLLAEIMSAYREDPRLPINKWSRWADDFRTSSRLNNRPFSTIFVDHAVRDEAIGDMRQFIGASDWYRDHGIPYRRGYLFEGPPGTGKTTTILALAAELGLPVNVLSLTSIKDDQSLEEAFNSASSGFLVIEDVDAVTVSQSREDGAALAKAGDGANGVTLSGLLNAIDGIGAGEGRILILTTNHPEKLDPALVRAGRIDIRLHFGPLEESLARDMCVHFLKAEGVAFFEEEIRSQLPIIPADLQGILMKKVGIGSGKEIGKPSGPPG